MTEAYVALPWKYHPVNGDDFGKWCRENDIEVEFTNLSAHDRDADEWWVTTLGYPHHLKIFIDDGDYYVWKVIGDDSTFSLVKLTWSEDMLEEWELNYGDSLLLRHSNQTIGRKL